MQETHTETHFNQADKSKKQKNLESNTWKVTHHVWMMPINIISGFSAELFQARRHRDDRIKVLKEKKTINW